MIIGRGSIASILIDREEFIFFANGISNRLQTTQELKEKEKNEILEFINTEKMFVYFSGLNIYYTPELEYTKHKIEMEEIIKNNFKNYCIFRIGSITWGDNPNTLVNFFRNKLKNDEYFEIQNAYRYLHTKEEIQHWIELIPKKGKHEMNVTGRMIKVIDLIEEIKQNKI